MGKRTSDPGDYYRANQGMLEAIISQTERLLTTPATTEVHQNGIDGRIILHNCPTAENVYARYGITDLSEESAAEVAAFLGEQLEARAATDIIFHLAAIRMRYAALVHDTEGRDPSLAEIETATSYQTAQWHTASYAPPSLTTLQLRKTAFHNAPAYQSAISYEIEQNDELLRRRLSVLVIDDEICLARESITPIENELLRECQRVFGAQFADVTLILGARFEDEEELDILLNELWLSQRGKGSEEKAGPLLDLVRQRTLATKHSTLLSVEHDLGRPDTNTLTDVEALLAGL